MNQLQFWPSVPSKVKLRNRFADYISKHYGALWGNFFFGVMLGLTAYVGYLVSLPLDIRHVAFSVSNVGYSSVVIWPGIWIFLEFVFFALLIGVINLAVSFFLALNVAYGHPDLAQAEIKRQYGSGTGLQDSSFRRARLLPR